MPRALKFHPFVRYILTKRKEKTLWQNYIADMLWAPANGMQFKNSKRWAEIIMPQKQETKQENIPITKKLVKELFMQKLQERGGE